MRVVVTGAAGFIGSHLCDALLVDGHTVVGIDCFTDYYAEALKEANLDGARRHPAFDLHRLDLRKDDLDDALAGADVVINEAAAPGLVRSWEDFETYQSCNLLAVHRLAEACRRQGVGRIVHASTSSVYGTDAVGDETSATAPVSPYGVTKLAAEHLLLAHHRSFGLPVVILRYFSVYGPRQRPDMAYRIFTEQLLRGEPITVYGDGHQSRSNTYVSDCVDATVRAMDRGEPGTVLNIGGGQEITLLAAIEVLAGELGATPVIDFRPPRPGDQRRTAADTTRARQALDWWPTVDPAVGLKRQAAWGRDGTR